MATETIYNNGDVVIIFGDSASPRRVLVYSVIMSNASPVFAAMFSGRFAEGQALSPISPKEVSFGDDEPSALELLLQLVHQRSKDVPKHLEPKNLVELASLADKYDCSCSIYFAAQTYLQKNEAKAISFVDCGNLAAAAYSLGQQEEFRRFTGKLAYLHTCDFADLIRHGDCMLPIQTLCKLLQKPPHTYHPYCLERK